jgi:proteasome lid subunit RPN8/RPN11
VFDKFLSIPRGGLEIGGVLFGTISHSEIRLLTYRPLEIEYLNGPSFVLSTTDESNLARLMEASQSDPQLEGMEPVGWYHSHTRSNIALSDEDVAVHQNYFLRPEHFALVIRPHKFEPAQAGFFLRSADGTLRSDAPQASIALLPPGKDGVKSDDAPAPSPIATPPAAAISVDEPPCSSRAAPLLHGNPRLCGYISVMPATN